LLVIQTKEGSVVAVEGTKEEKRKLGPFALGDGILTISLKAYRTTYQISCCARNDKESGEMMAERFYCDRFVTLHRTIIQALPNTPKIKEEGRNFLLSCFGVYENAP
jgi:hypothetical protein